MRSLRFALLLAGLALVGPLSAGPTAPAASAHAQLVASVPGAGQALESAPAQLRLVFSERLTELGSSLDLLDAQGRAIVRSVGDVVDDGRTLTAQLPPLDEGLYTVSWRSLSSEDGHTAQGFFTFGVGEVAVPALGDQTGGDVHAGHSPMQAIVETLARALAELGAMLALGLVLMGVAIVRPLDRSALPTFVVWAGLSAAMAGGGAALLVPLVADRAGVDALAYVAASANGQLLAARAATGIGVAALVVIPALLGASARQGALVAAGGGAALIVLLAASGHAATFGAPAPLLAVVVHVAAAAAWLAGLVTLAWLVFAEGGRRRALLRLAIPRFSAVALVSVALFTLSGAYLWWLMIDQPIDLASAYGRLLLLKAALVTGALAVGGLNYLGWRYAGRLGIHHRVALEAGLALAVLGVTAWGVSGSPPGPTRPIPIEQVTVGGASRLDATLAILPARPGPNQLSVTLAQPIDRSQEHVELVLQRLDQAAETRVELVPAPGSDRRFSADVPLAAGSRWDATVRRHDGGVEQARSRFTFGFDDARLVSGQERSVIEPPVVLALLTLAGAILAATIALAGGGLPRTDQRLSRLSLAVGGVAAAAFGLAALLLGPTL